MKKLLCIVALFLFVASLGFAQTEKQIKKDIHSKAMKEARKEAKKLKKENFTVAPGQLPMDKQIEATWIKRSETDDKGIKKWFVADARSLGETHTAAKMQANEVAKINLASQVSTEVAGLIETSIANAQLNADEAASVTETVATFKSIVGAKLGRTSTLFEASRTKGNNTEVYITLGYNYQSAMEIAKSYIRDDLKKKTKIQSDKLDKILDF